MKSKNYYHLSFVSQCPNDDQYIDYDLVIETEEVIMVEDILEEVSKFTQGYHEDIADLLYAKFGGFQTLDAIHCGVDVSTERGEK